MFVLTIRIILHPQPNQKKVYEYQFNVFIMENSFTKISKKSFLVAIAILTTSIGFSQLAVPFKIRHQGYVKGDMTMIANNIVNRVDYNNDSNSPHDSRAYQGELNDEFMMLYTDIDNDKSTFSSSSADLYLNNPLNKKIVYAGLYWSATYLYNSGISKKENKFKAVDPKRDSFDEIKIKLPNQNTYTTIKGELLFDGIKDPKFKESAPYAMYADVTQMVKNLKDPTGTYTIANIKATQGKISGGVSGGWSIFFVYEDEDMTGRFITTYDGFAGVTDKPTEINITGFQTLPSGEVKAKIACAALEGDLNLKGDQLQFKAAENNEFTQLQNALRDRANIFNSSISMEGKYFETRKPASKNTLGYDSFIMNLENFDNSVLGNNTTDATIKLKTTGDRYFVFFNAFDVEVIQPKELPKANEELITSTEKNEPKASVPAIKIDEPKVAVVEKPVVKEIAAAKVIEPTVIKKEPVAVVTPAKEVKATEIKEPVKEIKSETVVAKVEPVKEVKKEVVAAVEKAPAKTTTSVAAVKPQIESVTQNTTLQTQTIVKAEKPTPIESPAVLIASQPEGYYIIVNVFAIHSNATKFVAKLKRKGMFADYFINPINNYRYVYVSKHDSFNDARQMYASNINGQYYDDFWIMTVNKQNNADGVAYNTSNTINQTSPITTNSIAVLTRQTVITDEKKYLVIS